MHGCLVSLKLMTIFLVRTTQNNKYTKIECKLDISQRQTDHNRKSSLYFLENIAEFLSITVKSIRLDKPNFKFKIRTTNLKGNLNL